MLSNNSSISLKAKIALAAGLLAVLVLMLQAWVQIVFVRADQRELVGQQLDALVGQAARELDDKIGTRQLALEGAARAFPLDALRGEDTIEAYLKGQGGLLNLVDDLYVFSPKGTLLADWPVVQGRRQLDMSERDYIQRTVATSHPQVSEPIVGRITRKPLVILTAPILDEAGQLRAILAGVLDLYQPKVLGDLRTMAVGKSGYFVLTHPNHNVIMHPSLDLLLKPAADLGVEIAARGRQAGRGWQLAETGDAAPALLAAHRLKSTGWTLSGVFPLEEAYSPIRRMVVQTLVTTFVLVFVVMVLIWLTTLRFLKPLDRLARQIRGLYSDGKIANPARNVAVVIEGSEEIRELSGAFNEFMERTQRAESELVANERRLSLVLETATDGIWDWDIRGGKFVCNKALAGMLGLPGDRAVSISTRDIANHLLEEERLAVRIAIRRCLSGHTETYRSEHRILRDDGEIIWVLERGRVVEYDEGGRPARMVGSFTDITAQKQNEERIRTMALYDTLTGLPNRRLMADRIVEAMLAANSEQGRLALFFLDLDHFKNINDTLGHSTGDRLLRAVGQRLADCVGERATVARQGGDEFVVLVPCAEPQALHELAETILRESARPYSLEDRLLSISPSIGISIYPDDASDLDSLFRHADIAMYRAKDAGRNGYCFFTAQMNEQICRRLELETAMRGAIADEAFFLCYQPQVDLRSGRLVGVEALARWNHAHLGRIEPAAFIPVAENSGLIIQLGEWVLRTACRYAASLQEAGLPPFAMAVNISAIQFRHPELPALIARVLAETGLAPACLELELTEGVLMENTVDASVALHRLRAMGVRLSIDDFGTGYSSLGYLKTFPIDKLKIDRSFVIDLVDNAQDRAIVGAIVNLGHTLGLAVIAEGVETAAQRDQLILCGCDEFQGYFASRPLPGDELLAWLRARGEPVGAPAVREESNAQQCDF